MKRLDNKILSSIGFVTSVLGISGLLFGKFLLYIFPIPFVCGILLIKNKKTSIDLINAITCIVITGILLFYKIIVK